MGKNKKDDKNKVFTKDFLQFTLVVLAFLAIWVMYVLVGYLM